MNKHNRRSKAQWLALFQQQKESNQNAAEFCRLNNLNDKYYSKRKGELTGSKKKKSTDDFIKVVSPSPSSNTSMSNITLHYRNSQLHLPQETDVNWLVNLLTRLP